MVFTFSHYNAFVRRKLSERRFSLAFHKGAVKKKLHQQPQKSFLFLWLLVQFFFHHPLLSLRPGSHGCKIWLFVREALQFPWILQQNLEAAARSEEKREAARRAASRAAAAEKSAGCSACNVRTNVRSRSSGLVFSSFLFSFSFFLEKRTFSANEDLFE